MTHRDGYIIANRHWMPEIKLAMAGHTFAASAAHAWRRHIGREANDNSLEFSTIVQRWSDKGYGPIKVRLSLA